ncbi:MAG: hypothetical protein U0574_08385 [Phycisphaerales bacterium]
MEYLTTKEVAAKPGVTPGRLRPIAIDRKIRTARMAANVAQWAPKQLADLKPRPAGRPPTKGATRGR